MDRHANVLLMSLVFVLLSGCCTYDDCSVSKNRFTLNDGEKWRHANEMLSGLREGMTFTEIKNMFHLTADMITEVHHDGNWCDVEVGGGYYIVLRFEAESERRLLPDCKVNLTPVLKRAL